MPRMWRKFSAALLVLAWALVPARAQVAVVTVKSIDDAMADIQYLLKVAGQEERAKQLDELIKSFTNNKGFQGIDTKRPLGLYVNLPKGLDADPAVVVFVPVAKETDLLDLLKEMNLNPSKPVKGMYTLDLPNGEKMFMKFGNRYAYGSDKEENLAGNLPDPSTVIPASAKNSLVAASFRIDQVSKDHKKLFLDGILTEFENQKEKQPGESDAQHQARLAGMSMAKDVMAMLVDESKDLTLGLQVDRKQDRIALDLALTAMPGSRLAGHFKAFGAARSMFSGFAKDAAASLLINLPLPEDLRKQLAQLFEQGFKEGLKDIKDEKERKLAEKVFETLKNSLIDDSIDIGAALRGPLPDKKFVIVAGAKVKDGKKLEDLVRDLIKEIPAADRAKIKLDHDKIGNLSVHLIQADANDPEVERIFGKANLYVVMKQNVALMTFGEHGMTAMKDALAMLDKPAAQATAPIQLELAISKLMLLAPPDQLPEELKKIFQGADKDKDKVKISIQGGDALRLRLDVDAQIIKLIAAAIQGVAQ